MRSLIKDNVIFSYGITVVYPISIKIKRYGQLYKNLYYKSWDKR